MKQKNEEGERFHMMNSKQNRNGQKNQQFIQKDQYVKNQHKLEVASQSDLNLVQFDLLKLVGQFKKQGDMQKKGENQFERRQTTQQDLSLTELGGGYNFMEGSIIDFFNLNQQNQMKYLNEQKIMELQENIRCDTDLLQLVKQNLNNGKYQSPTTIKKRSLVFGLPEIRKCSSSNIKEGYNDENSFEIEDDEYNLSPISRKQSIQLTQNTFGELNSLAYLDKGITGEQLSYLNTGSQTSIKSEPKTTNSQLISSSNLQNGNNQHISSTEDISNSNYVRLSVKRQSSVRFKLPNSGLEKIRESDEKEEEMNTKTSNTEFSPEKKRIQLGREKKHSANSSGILKGILQEKNEEQSSFSSNDDYYDNEEEQKYQQQNGNMLIKDYFNEDEKENIAEIFVPRLNLGLQEYSNSGINLLSSGCNTQRNSLFFSQNVRFLDMTQQEDEQNKIAEYQENDQNVDKSNYLKSINTPSPRSPSDNKNAYLQKRQSAYFKLEDLQKNYNNDNNMLLQPKLYHQNTLQTPGTPGNNTSNISSNSYVTFFNKNPDQSVIETSQVKKEVDDEGQKKINSYTLLHELGRGGFGKVKLASSEFPTDDGVIVKNYAIKIANKQKLKRKLISMKVNAFTLLEREVAIMKKIDHPHLVKLYEVIDDPEDDKIYMVMEYMQKGSIMSTSYWKKELKENNQELYDKIFGGEDQPNKKKLEMLPKRLQIDKCRIYFQQFALAIDYMHNFAQVIHRDIKPENILMDEDDNLKIADFGVSHIMESCEDSEMKDNAGTKAFTAPEGWSKNFKGKPLDMWASGVTLYNMAFGELPFFSKDQIKLRNSIINDEVKIPEGTDPILADLIQKLLIKNPDQRLTSQEMLVN